MRVVVVGASVLGLSAAYHAARAGASVVVVDQAHDGRASAAGAGIICPWVPGADDPDRYRLAAAGARYYPQLVEMLAQCGERQISYKQVGALLVSSDAAELDWMEREVRSLRAAEPAAGTSAADAAEIAAAPDATGAPRWGRPSSITSAQQAIRTRSARPRWIPPWFPFVLVMLVAAAAVVATAGWAASTRSLSAR